MTESTPWKILIIDDDEDDYLIAREMFAGARGRRIEAAWASTFEKGLALLFGPDASQAAFDAVFVDYDMGLHNGLELIREATGRGYPAPFLLLTGRGSYEVDVEAMAAGASMYLTKNEINPLLLERSIRYAIERKQAEDRLLAQKLELERANQQLQGMFDHAPAGMALFDAQPPYRVLAHNQIYQSIWREPFRSNSLVGRMLTDYAENAAESGILDVFEQVARTREGVTLYEFQYLMEERGPTWWNWTLSPIYENDRLVSFAHMVVDVTDEVVARQAVEHELAERMQAEKERRAAVTRLERLITSNVFGYLVADQDGVIHEANEYFLNLLGCDRGDLDGGRIEYRAITPPEHYPADRRASTEMLQDGICHPYEKEFFRKDGSRVWVVIAYALLPAGDSGYVVAFVLDVQKQKQMEEDLDAYMVGLHRANLELMEELRERRRIDEELRASESRLQTLADALPQLIWTARPDGRIVFCNIRHKDYQGFSQDEAGIWHWTESAHPDDLPRMDAAWRKALAGGEIYEVENRMRLASGEYHWHLTRAVPMVNDEGEIVQWHGTSTDINEQKEAQLALERANARLKQQ